ncbi:unnamed protein product, partial [Brenthis ino]
MPADSRRKGRRRTRTPSPSNTLNEILKRLQDLEERARGSELLSASVVTPEPCRALTMPSTPLPAVEPATTPACAPPASAQDVAATSTPAGNDAKSVAERFLDAIIQFPVISVLPNDRYELRLLAGSYGKTSQAAAGCMVLWRGEWTPDTCAGFFESCDEDQDQDGADPSSRTDEDREDAAMSGEAVLDGNTI